MDLYTKEHEKFCVKLRNTGKKRREIVELFMQKFDLELTEDHLGKILKRNSLVKSPNIVFYPWMIDYIKKEYKSFKDISRIAKHLKVTNKQISQKIDYLSLNKRANCTEVINNNNEDDAVKLYKKIRYLKSVIVPNVSKVKVKYSGYNSDFLIENSIKEPLVVATYPQHIGVIINGHRVSYAYSEIIAVM